MYCDSTVFKSLATEVNDADVGRQAGKPVTSLEAQETMCWLT